MKFKLQEVYLIKIINLEANRFTNNGLHTFIHNNCA
jgi:hypothetical protein